MIPGWAWVDTGLTAEECALLVKYGVASLEAAGTACKDEGKRQGKVSWFLKGQEPAIDPLIQKAVDAFGFAVESFFAPWHLTAIEPIQYTHYESGDFYGWHYDSIASTTKRPRHYSASVELSDPDTYKGGGLEFHETIDQPIPERKLGRLIVFPSLLLHRARKVQSGTRSSLVLWGQAIYE